MAAPLDPRLEGILEVLLAYARQDFTRRAPVSDAQDTIDALATGLNMMAEELSGAVASRRELEAAYRSLKETQARLVHSGKMIAVGQLASGVAHEINNPASWVMLSLAAVSRELGALRELAQAGADPAEVRDVLLRMLGGIEASIAHALDGIERIRTVTSELRTFSRIDGESSEVLSLSEVANSAVSLAAPFLRQRARLEIDLGDGPWVTGNRGRLGQVTTNLLANAAQAVTDRSQDEKIRLCVFADGAEAVLRVEDSGPGVPPELREQIFDPFFTTKVADQGTGLGLSLVAEIVRRHHGSVRVSDSPLGGASFEVRMPRVDRPEQREDRSAVDTLAKRLRILIVDDEPNLLKTFSMVLQPEHEVCVAQGGAAALARLEVDRSFDAVLCDLQMPDVDGIAVYQRLKEVDPALANRVVFSTGGAFHSRVKDFIRDTHLPVLEKPFTVQTLLATIARRHGDT